MRRAALIALLVTFALEGVASAHAQLQDTRPARGAQLDRAPEQIELRFSENVTAGAGSVRVFDGRGREVQQGDPRADGDRVGIDLPENLPDGGYTATYRVISADSHPVSGGFSFTIGSGGPGAQSVDRLLETSQSGPVTATALGTARAVQYAAIVLALGALLFFALCWPKGVDSAPVSRLLLVSAVAGVLSAVAGLFLHGAQASGGPLEARLDTQFGVTWLLAAVGWLAVAALRRSGWAVLPAGGLAVVPAAGGHASVEGALMLVSNLVHVIAVAAWIGGLATLVLALRPATRGRRDLAEPAIARFSNLALALVGVVLLTGVLQSLVELSAWSELLDTAYGRAVLIKLGLFAVLLGFGAFHRRRALPPLRTLRAELAVATVVLGVTGALATYVPGKDADVGPVSRSATIGPARMELTVDPARTGVNELHLYLFDRRTGAQFDRPKEVTAEASRGDLELPVELRKAGPGHYVAQQATFPRRGDWSLTVTARVSDFDQFTTDTEVEIR